MYIYIIIIIYNPEKKIDRTMPYNANISNHMDMNDHERVIAVDSRIRVDTSILCRSHLPSVGSSSIACDHPVPMRRMLPGYH